MTILTQVKIVDESLREWLGPVKVLVDQISAEKTGLGDPILRSRITARFETLYAARQDFVKNYGEMR